MSSRTRKLGVTRDTVVRLLRGSIVLSSGKEIACEVILIEPALTRKEKSELLSRAFHDFTQVSELNLPETSPVEVRVHVGVPRSGAPGEESPTKRRAREAFARLTGR